VNTTGLYETDFYAWIQRQAELLKEKQFDGIDFENLIEELEAMGRSEKRQLLNRLAQLIAHLLNRVVFFTFLPIEMPCLSERG
jgi:hypothetical protein